MPWTAGAAARGRSRRCCSRRARGSGATSAGAPRSRSLDDIVADGLAVARGAPARLRGPDGGLMSRLKGVLADPLLSVVMPGLQRAGHDRGDPRARGWRCPFARRSSSSTTARPTARARHPRRPAAAHRVPAVPAGAQPGQGRGAAARLRRGRRRSRRSSRTPTSSTRRRSTRADRAHLRGPGRRRLRVAVPRAGTGCSCSRTTSATAS
ncbi:MAG: hypothetical protein MZV64_73055 [Ignavibacteriales bacterium]|nr:hypothetical protein [Ignavibacteriales bacterium]